MAQTVDREKNMGQRIQKRTNSSLGADEELSFSSSTEDLLPFAEAQVHDKSDEFKALSRSRSYSSISANAQQVQNAVVSSTGLAVLCLLAVQNCSKNLLMRFVMKDQPEFLTSAAVLGVECVKLFLSVFYILIVQKKSLGSIFKYLKEDFRNTILLVVPASAYNLQMTLEYIALANLDAAVFSVLVQTKLLCTAVCAALVLNKKLRYVQVISLVLLTTGVMLCNLKGTAVEASESAMNPTKGIIATLGIAASSGLASVYTEKVIKGGNRPSNLTEEYGLAYTQVQLALMALLVMGAYAFAKDSKEIMEYGLFHNFTPAAFASILMSSIGGLIVASVLKFADSILKGYATALSVLMTGMLSQVLFGTQLSTVYFMGMINVIVAVLLYNGKNLDNFVCSSGKETN